MFEIGNSLREARLRQGLEFPEIEHATKVRSKYLRALEDEEFDILPAQTYVKGFLRTYAEYLGLDGQLYVDEYNSRYVGLEEESPLRASVRQPARQDRRFAGGAVFTVLAGIAVLTALVIAAFKFTGGSGSTDKTTRPPAKHVDEEGPDAQDRGEVGLGADPGDPRIRLVRRRPGRVPGRASALRRHARAGEDPELPQLEGLAADRCAGERDFQRRTARGAPSPVRAIRGSSSSRPAAVCDSLLDARPRRRRRHRYRARPRRPRRSQRALSGPGAECAWTGGRPRDDRRRSAGRAGSGARGGVARRPARRFRRPRADARRPDRRAARARGGAEPGRRFRARS